MSACQHADRNTESSLRLTVHDPRLGVFGGLLGAPPHKLTPVDYCRDCGALLLPRQMLERCRALEALLPLPLAAGPGVTCIDGKHDICGGSVSGTHRCACRCHNWPDAGRAL